jgi:hypothetical protein
MRHAKRGQMHPHDQLAQLDIAVRQRLVEQDHRRVVGERSRQRDALLLAGRVASEPEDANIHYCDVQTNDVHYTIPQSALAEVRRRRAIGCDARYAFTGAST